MPAGLPAPEAFRLQWGPNTTIIGPPMTASATPYSGMAGHLPRSEAFPLSPNPCAPSSVAVIGGYFDAAAGGTKQASEASRLPPWEGKSSGAPNIRAIALGRVSMGFALRLHSNGRQLRQLRFLLPLW